ncbi:MAG: hypothetical protein FJX64_02385 [Alphaproteobacteria bacterium]|nr:hypothetical protein [Alphaproteobacteria bacterium]
MTAGAWAQGALPIPRFVSLRSGEVNVRTGPGMQYPVAWVFVRAGLPVEVIATFDVWRKVRDIDGVEGWVHQNLLSGDRHAIITGGEVRTLTRAATTAVPVAQAEPGVIAKVLACSGAYCRLDVAGHKGWLPREQIWGVYPNETLD